jgi:ketosteroid isomerase-like protein
VQSDETLHKLGALDRELIEARVHAILERRAVGDVLGMLDFATDDIRINIKGDWAAFPYQRPVVGKKMVAEALSMIAIQYENLGSVVHELIIDGDRVAMRRTAGIRHRGTGKAAEIEIADFLRFRDGLVADFFEIIDTAALARLDDT